MIQVEKDRQNLINENFKLTENYHKTVCAEFNNFHSGFVIIVTYMKI